MNTLSPALMASTSEVLLAAASTWMGYLARLAAAAQPQPQQQQPQPTCCTSQQPMNPHFPVSPPFPPAGGRGAAEPSGPPTAAAAAATAAAVCSRSDAGPAPAPAAADGPPCAVPLPTPAEVASLVSCGLGPVLISTVRQHLQATLETQAIPAFWKAMTQCRKAAAAGDDDAVEQHLLAGLQGLCAVVDEHCAGQQQLAAMVTAALLQGCSAASPMPAAAATATQPPATVAAAAALYSEQALSLVPVVARLTKQYRTAVSALLMATAEISVSELLVLYFSSKLSQLAQTLAPLEQLLEAQEDGVSGGSATAPGGTATAAGGIAMDAGCGGGGGSGGLLAAMAATGFGTLALSGGGGNGGGVRRVSECGGGGGGGGGRRISDAVEGVAILMGSAVGESTENSPPSSLQHKALQPSAVAAAMGSSWVRRLVAVCVCLSRLSLDPAGEEAVEAAVSHHVQRLLYRLAWGVFDREVLPAANRAANRIPLEFLRLVTAGDSGSGSATATPASASTCVRTATGTAPLSAAATARNGASEQTPQPETPASAATAVCCGGGATGGGGAIGGLAEPGTEVRTLTEWRLRLSYLVYETLGRLRISEMFDIVVDYPDSLPAIRDLATCLRHTNLQSLFVSSFKRALQQRLLHAGASATGIIHQYVATIRAMREIDPSGSLLHAVAQPIREYLRGRSDTIKCLVSMVTQDGGGPNGESLLEELQAAAAASGAAAAATMDLDNDTSKEDADERVLRVATATATAGFPGVLPSPAGAA
ncbi:hypothetical protein VaNZ11_006824, partial [Volvox africanus]